jgi:DNA-binding LacI/PurR family transcriptional regulator
MRAEGYKEAMNKYGLGDKMDIEIRTFKPKDGYNLAKQMLERNPKIDAFFAANDHTAFGIIKAIKELGLRIPEDIAIMGFQDLPEATLISPSLSTVRTAPFDMGVKRGEYDV